MQEGDIIIYRNNEAIATVPITPSATKEWKLMERDCCTLVFNVTEPIYFQIGNYISYGGHKYYISEEPLPADYSNGVYKHTLQFDRDYMLWKNITFQMTHIKHVDGTDNYVRTRNEVSWSLTDVLEKHIQELIYNVEISGAKVDERYVAKYVPGPGGGVLRPVYRNHIAYCVDGRNLIVYDPTTEQFYVDEEALTEDFYFRGVETRKEMAFIQYNGTDLLSALKTICETYHCEWWVKTITPNPESQPIHPEPYFVLCLGKCEYGDYIDFKMTPEGTDYADLFDADNLDIQDADDSDIHTADINSAGADGVINVEKMSLARNTEEYANRLYVFGSTKNLPDTYRKKLEFEASDIGNQTLQLQLDEYVVGDDIWEGGQPTPSRAAFLKSAPIPVTPGMVITYNGLCEGHVDCVVGFDSWQAYEQPDGSHFYDVLQSGNYTTSTDVTIPNGVSLIVVQSQWLVEGTPFGSAIITLHAFEDTNRKLSRSMIVSNNDFDAEKDSTSFDISSSTGAPNGYFRVNLNDLVVRTTGKYQISFPFSCFVTNKANHPYVYTPWDYAITIDGTRVYYYAPEQRTTLNGESLSIGGTALFETELTAGTHDFQLTYRFHLNESAAHRTIGATAQIDGSLSARYLGDINTTLTFDGNDYPIILASWIDNWKGFAFSCSAPTGFGVGSKYSIAEVTDEADGLSPYKVPSNYYSYDNGSINSVYLSGERRLQLPITEDYPEGIPYIDPEETITAENLVEKVVIFDDIFPKCALRIIAIKEYVGNVEVETYADGTSKYEETANYFIAVKLVTVEGDKDFPFKEDMRIDGTNLQIKFLTQDEEKKYTANGEVYGDTEHGYQLSGLTFDVAYVSFVADTDGARYKGFQIARNKDFGAMFPNLNRKPIVGDTLVLSGWNVKAMQSLGLITQAENALKTAGYAYKEALKNDLFTFDCTMMSDWMRSRINNDWVGQKARVFHRSLKDKDNQTQTKESRVIGYQMKLDIPYDSPVLTIGETEAYSRLKALERALNGETRNSSVGGAINATSGGGSVVVTNEWYNIKTAKDSDGKLIAIIENYSSKLTDADTYKMLLLRWRKSTNKPRYSSWHSPLMSKSSTNNIAEENRSWPITSNKQVFFSTTGDDYSEVLPLGIKQRRSDGKHEFRNNHNRKIRFGCAIYKHTGEGTYGWQRVSNIAEVELFLTNDGDIMLNIRK